jgi:rod shape-determining protein MreD
MRWITFGILLYLATALQVAHFGQWSEAGYFHVEFIPMLAVFYALYPAEDYALLACLCCGFMYDLTGIGLLGVNTILLSLAGYGITRIRMNIFRQNPISQAVLVFLTVVFVLLGRNILTRMGLWSADQPMTVLSGYAPTIGITLSSAIYTAIVAPWVFRGLFMIGPLLGFDGPSHHVRNRNR